MARNNVQGRATNFIGSISSHNTRVSLERKPNYILYLLVLIIWIKKLYCHFLAIYLLKMHAQA